MKKFLQIALVSVLSFGFISTASAATEQDVKDAVSKTYTIAGNKVSASQDMINEVDNYLRTNELTSDQAQAVIDAINSIKNTMDSAGTVNPNELSQATKNEILSIAQNAASKLGMTVSYDAKSQTLNVYKDGKRVLPVHLVKAGTNTYGISLTNGKPAKTGRDYTAYAAFSGLALAALAGATVIRKKKENEA